jgi:hypothetical protein
MPYHFSFFLLSAAILLWTSPDAAFAATFHVATTGNNQKGNGSAAKPWASIGHGIRQLKGGDTLVVRAGVYQGTDQFMNTRLSPIANGTREAFTTIKAEVPFSVRIQNGGALKYQDAMVSLAAGTQYVHIDGFIFDMVDTYYPSMMVSIDGSFNKLTRSIFRREGSIDEYAGWVLVNGKYNLVEDCAGVGAARYGFITGGPESGATNNIFRRCVARVDYTNSQQPKAAFSVYGNNTTNAVRDMLFQNCMVIDSHRGPSQREDNYGGFYFSKNATNVTVQGGVVLNTEVGHAAYFLKEQQGQNIRIEHSIAWDVRGHQYFAGLRANGDAGESLILNHLTIGKLSAAFYNKDKAAQRVLKNSLFSEVGKMTFQDNGWTAETHNAFSPSGLSRGRSSVTSDVKLKYLTRAEPASGLYRKADDGQDIGANLTRRYGVSGTLWGEAGYDQLAGEPLWPWPYEEQIKAVFAQKNNPPPGFMPATNETVRGFTVATDAFGQPMTLTRYIWQYLGNPIPPEIYAGSKTPGR